MPTTAAPGIPGLRRRVLHRSSAESITDVFFKGLTGLTALGLIAILILLAILLFQRAEPAVDAFGWHFLISRAWDPPGQNFGALPYVWGTVSTSVLALIFAVPVSVGTSLALTQLLPKPVSLVLGFLVELLAAVPSIIYGVWGFTVVVPRIRDMGGEGTFGYSTLSASVVLAVMMLPIITAVSRDMIHAVPRHQKDAALALGATPWEVSWRVILPHARAGLVAAAILGLGRAVGETMAVIMVVGNQPIISTNVFEPAATIASLIANEFGDPSGPLHTAALMELGLILLGISLALNLVARLLVRMLAPRMGVQAE